ncbi:hypothetical protein N431DRAFT_483030 [Stipitochalara longipes BDJ]|nr:hypothetical protein N431DRAFT_483030 [Stipitochalara longipes BDJ]
MSTPLPSTRQLFTSLLNSLTAPIPERPSNLINEPYSTTSNPLEALPSSQRALLTTLHVLFPPPMLLYALDLLDRGLVLRVTERSSANSMEIVEEEEATRPTVFPPQANIHLPRPSSPRPSESTSKGEKKSMRNTVYQVRSSQPSKSRFRDSAGAATGTNIYTVRLQAWNCSCAAFAFSAFPGGLGVSGMAAWNINDGEKSGIGKEGEGKDEEWEFGGLSFNGREGEGGNGVPVCKHLVACLLGERWDLLGRYVKEKEVSKEEMGGVGGEG